MQTEEYELVQRAKLGDKRAFEQLVCRHDRHVMQIALAMINNIHDARDIYQESFIRVYTHLSSFQCKSSFKTWVTRITVNVALNHRRKKWSRSRISLKDNDMPEKKDKTNPVRNLLNKELGTAIKNAIGQLSPKQQAVFTLKHHMGYKIREIAEILDCSEGTVKSDLFRAVEKLQKNLKTFYSEQDKK